MQFLALGPADSAGCVCCGETFYKQFCKLQQRSKIFTKHSETQTAIQLSAPSENMCPIHVKGLYLFTYT